MNRKDLEEEKFECEQYLLAYPNAPFVRARLEEINRLLSQPVMNGKVCIEMPFRGTLEELTEFARKFPLGSKVSFDGETE